MATSVPGAPRATVVETIPMGMDDLEPRGESTVEALVRLLRGATETVDFTALYWSLSPTTTDEDTTGWSEPELLELGATQGIILRDALMAAAARGVRLRVIESPGFEGDTTPSEFGAVVAAYPQNVAARTVGVDAWYGGGIMHQKLWIFDGRAVYVGSANMDWRSLSQVKELGVVIEDAPDVGTDATRYFDAWWELAAIPPADHTVRVFDPEHRVARRVPAWSRVVPSSHRRTNPLDTPALRGDHGWDQPLRLRLGEDDGELFLSGAPAELCTGRRTFDGDALVATILDARTSVCVNVMDFAPVSVRGVPTGDGVADDGDEVTVWWPALHDAILHAVTTTRVHARLLVSQWAHTSRLVAPYLAALAATARAAAAHPDRVPGRLEVRRFRVPGWRDTGPKLPGEPVRFPGHTRVNHVKYLVTDRRANIGTSNMTWDYFYGTAGTSLNATHAGLVRRLQVLFDRDWRSDYALPA